MVWRVRKCIRDKVMIEETGKAADAAGFEAFLIFDADESVLAQGA